MTIYHVLDSIADADAVAIGSLQEKIKLVIRGEQTRQWSCPFEYREEILSGLDKKFNYIGCYDGVLCEYSLFGRIDLPVTESSKIIGSL